MWNLQHHIRELPQHDLAPQQGRVLLVHCRLVKDAATEGGDRCNQSVLMDMLQRQLQRRLEERGQIVQVSQSDVLVVLMTRNAATDMPAIEQSIGEIRRRLLGENAAPGGAFSADAVKTGARGPAEMPRSPAADGAPPLAPPGGTSQDAAQVDAGEAPPFENLRFTFTPVWDVKRRAITTYYLDCKAGSGEQAGYDVLDRGTKSPFVPDLDLEVLKRAAAELAQYANGKAPFMLVWTVHARTIESREKFQRYADVMSRMAEDARSRMAVVLRGIRPDWPLERVQRVIGAVRRHCRVVTARRRLGSGMLPQLLQCGADNVALDLHDMTDDPAEVSRLKKFCAAADRLGMGAVGHRVPTLDAALVAVAAGFSFVHGEFLVGSGERPEPASRYDVIDLVNASPDLGMSSAAAPARHAAAVASRIAPMSSP